jgi:hypothetical protein
MEIRRLKKFGDGEKVNSSGFFPLCIFVLKIDFLYSPLFILHSFGETTLKVTMDLESKAYSNYTPT